MIVNINDCSVCARHGRLSSGRRPVIVAARPRRTRPAALSEDPGFLLARAGGQAIRQLNRTLEHFGVRSRHYTALVAVKEREGVSQRELSEILDIDPSAVVAVIDDLERAGYVSRTPNPDDRRTRMVVLTAAGRAALAKMTHLSAAVDEHILSALEPGERELFVDMLCRVARLKP